MGVIVSQDLCARRDGSARDGRADRGTGIHDPGGGGPEVHRHRVVGFGRRFRPPTQPAPRRVLRHG